jgi:hypothetical protein
MPPNTSLTIQALIITLKSPVSGKTTVQIHKETGISIQQINRIYAQAISRGFNPNIQPFTLKEEWLKDAPRSGRPLKQTPENIDNIITKVYINRYGQEKTAANLTS